MFQGASAASFLSGLGIGLSLIVAIGAQNAFVLAQSLRREHHIPVAALCILCDAVLVAAGVFGLAGFDAAGLDAMLGAQCPAVLYPYVRSAISDLVSNGGFPPFQLQPINFDALYAEGLRQRAQQGGEQPTTDQIGNA